MAKQSKDLIRSIREAVQADKILIPGNRKRANWPLCLTCGREPHKVNLEEVTRTKIEIRAWCTHKAEPLPEDPEWEDSVVVNVPFGAERDEHIGWALRSGRFFDPAQVPK